MERHRGDEGTDGAGGGLLCGYNTTGPETVWVQHHRPVEKARDGRERERKIENERERAREKREKERKKERENEIG